MHLNEKRQEFACVSKRKWCAVLCDEQQNFIWYNNFNCENPTQPFGSNYIKSPTGRLHYFIRFSSSYSAPLINSK